MRLAFYNIIKFCLAGAITEILEFVINSWLCYEFCTPRKSKITLKCDPIRALGNGTIEKFTESAEGYTLVYVNVIVISRPPT